MVRFISIAKCSPVRAGCTRAPARGPRDSAKNDRKATIMSRSQLELFLHDVVCP